MRKNKAVTVDYISDLHLDFWIPFNPSQEKWESRTKGYIEKLILGSKAGEILCLAGDISHFNQQSYWALETFSKYYDLVYMVFGNHDYYLVSRNQSSKYKGNSMNRITELKEKCGHLDNIVFDGVIEYKDKTFCGITMWYPLTTLEQNNFFHSVSNDSVLIQGSNVSMLHCNDIKEYYNLPDIDVLITHVPIIHIDSHQKYKSTACYYTPVDELKAEYVIMGHSHERKIYSKPYGKFYMNAIGYPGEFKELPTIKNFEVKK